jgi:hypothetical protein
LSQAVPYCVAISSQANGIAASTMKFTQLPPDARFCWQGELYRKTGPMTAHADVGGAQKLIPRSAVVEPVANDAAAATTAEERFTAGVVQAALDAYQTSLRAYAQTLTGPERSALEAHMDLAERGFRAALRRKA